MGACVHVLLFSRLFSFAPNQQHKIMEIIVKHNQDKQTQSINSATKFLKYKIFCSHEPTNTEIEIKIPSNKPGGDSMTKSTLSRISHVQMTKRAFSNVLITPNLHFFKELLGLDTGGPLNDLLNQQVFSEMHCFHVAVLHFPIPSFLLHLGITLVFFSYLALQ